MKAKEAPGGSGRTGTSDGGVGAVGAPAGVDGRGDFGGLAAAGHFGARGGLVAGRRGGGLGAGRGAVGLVAGRRAEGLVAGRAAEGLVAGRGAVARPGARGTATMSSSPVAHFVLAAREGAAGGPAPPLHFAAPPDRAGRPLGVVGQRRLGNTGPLPTVRVVAAARFGAGHEVGVVAAGACAVVVAGAGAVVVAGARAVVAAVAGAVVAAVAGVEPAAKLAPSAAAHIASASALPRQAARCVWSRALIYESRGAYRGAAGPCCRSAGVNVRRRRYEVTAAER